MPPSSARAAEELRVEAPLGPVDRRMADGQTITAANTIRTVDSVPSRAKNKKVQTPIRAAPPMRSGLRPILSESEANAGMVKISINAAIGSR